MDTRIEPYFNKELSSAEQSIFEQDLRQNQTLAEEVAFYLQTRQLIRQELLAERHAVWQELAQRPQPRPIRPIWTLAAVAALLVIALGLGWNWLRPTSPTAQALAQTYIEQQLTSLPVLMDAGTDSLQKAIDSYNQGEFEKAGLLAQALLQQQPASAEALNLAGLSALRLQRYEQAIVHFEKLAQQKDLYANPGTFHVALALLIRNEPLDKKQAESLLKEVISKNLEGKEQAEKWLLSFDQ
ncbi:tetratricopeptide repeat protein [Arundinibacter roseus]|uniref:Tetratricopeptide repeat protein n=1 Tax=Arundinibacter roseus TaxID=2070510 RepID=A0A4R4KAW2_9BACT|nr:hypothetical protein [Arundinibacter roseus]TDB63786.1 hypothetical protein EZE20_15965 [Arundinibacter roseus]